MTKKEKFIRHMAKTGEVTQDELVMFLLQYYFLQGKTLTDYHNELMERYSQYYAMACLEQAQQDIKQYVKKKGV